MNTQALSVIAESSSTKNEKFLNAKWNQGFDSIIKASGTFQSGVDGALRSFFTDVATANVDYHLINKLWKGLGRGVNKQALKNWIVDFTPLKYNKEKDVFIRTKKAKWDLVKLQGAKPYYEYEKEKKESDVEWSATKKTDALKKHLEKLIGEFNDHQADATKLLALLAVL
jgi:hypothetical protein